MKPIGKAQGRGIFLFSKLNQISQWKTDYRWNPDNKNVQQARRLQLFGLIRPHKLY